MRPMRTALEIVFWVASLLIVWTQVGYGLLLAGLARVLAPAPQAELATRERPKPPQRSVSLIVAAHDEQAVIGAKVANALALDYPRELLQLIVACDGCGDATARRAREAGADLVLELERGGKIVAQDTAVERASGEIVAFSDANALWEPDALRELVGAFADPRVGYACGRVHFVQAHSPGASSTDPDSTDSHPPGAYSGDAHSPGAHTTNADPLRADVRATNQEGVYWRYEMALRARESRLSSITAGNGAIYATRRDSYIVVDPIMGHDLSFPFNMVKRGWRAVYVPSARATEKMVPSIEGELARKRRMMSHTWPIVLRGGMLSPRGYTPGYALMMLSHRVLRYLTPFLHALALAANVAILASASQRSGVSPVYTVTLALQLVLLAAAGLGGVLRVRPLLIARYYVLTTASLAIGLWDWLRHGTTASWEAAEGTR
jgi:cellulose synthase/poly-beta-1,6-N-acetylglucosamine synthase-like glycosyltransferase